MKTKTILWIQAAMLALSTVFLVTSCSKDDDVTKITYGSMTDIENNTYKTVTIGTQTWMAENLKVTKYNDGTIIPNVTGNYEWSYLTTGALCDYDNNPSNSDKYGKLYNWYAVETEKLCPAGWHVPSNQEWTELINYVGGESVSGGKLKETGTTHWASPNFGATNETGFTALPGGHRYSDGSFDDIGDYGLWWTDYEPTYFDAWFRGMGYDFNYVYEDYHSKDLGISIRCVRD